MLLGVVSSSSDKHLRRTMPTCGDVLNEPCAMAPFVASAGCKCLGGAPSNTISDVGVVANHECAVLAVEMRDGDVVEISRREWQPSQVGGLFAYKTTLNTHLSAA